VTGVSSAVACCSNTCLLGMASVGHTARCAAAYTYCFDTNHITKLIGDVVRGLIKRQGVSFVCCNGRSICCGTSDVIAGVGHITLIV